MAVQKVLVVLGATGQQGGGVARAALADPAQEYFVRAVTRDPGKEAAQLLSAAGAELVQADINDAASLAKAFAGADAVFAVTNFWEIFSGEKEKAQARNIADAARSAGVKHVVWSTLEDTRKLMSADDKRMPMLEHSYRVPHFDAKAEADAYFAGVPTTNLVTSFFWDNLLRGGGPTRGEDGSYSWTLPMGNARLAGIAADDIGRIAYGIFKGGSTYVGKTVGIYAEALPIADMSQKISAALGVGPVRYHAVEADVFRTFPFPGADEMGNMFQVYRDFEAEVLGARSPELARSLNPDIQTFDQYLANNRDKLMAAYPAAPAAG